MSAERRAALLIPAAHDRTEYHGKLGQEPAYRAAASQKADQPASFVHRHDRVRASFGQTAGKLHALCCGLHFNLAVAAAHLCAPAFCPVIGGFIKGFANLPPRSNINAGAVFGLCRRNNRIDQRCNKATGQLLNQTAGHKQALYPSLSQEMHARQAHPQAIERPFGNMTCANQPA